MMHYQDEKTKAYRILELISLIVDELEQLLPAFEAAFVGYMQHWTMEGKQRARRRYSQYTNCPLPTPAGECLFAASSKGFERTVEGLGMDMQDGDDGIGILTTIKKEDGVQMLGEAAIISLFEATPHILALRTAQAKQHLSQGNSQ